MFYCTSIKLYPLHVAQRTYLYMYCSNSFAVGPANMVIAVMAARHNFNGAYLVSYPASGCSTWNGLACPPFKKTESCSADWMMMRKDDAGG